MNVRPDELWLRARAAARRFGAALSGGETGTPGASLLEGLKAGNPAAVLKLLRGVFVALLVIQGLRIAVPVARAELLLRAAANRGEEKTREKFRDPVEKYNPILEKGVLGVPPQEQPPQLFGVLGDKVLIGGMPEQVQEYALDGVISTGEKIVKIGVESVELEKDGKKRTLTVFPEMQQQQ